MRYAIIFYAGFKQLLVFPEHTKALAIQMRTEEMSGGFFAKLDGLLSKFEIDQIKTQ